MGPKAHGCERGAWGIDGLTDAAANIARAVCGGATNAEIAAERGTSIRTVANQIAMIMQKLRVSSRVELAMKLAGAQRADREVSTAAALTAHEHRVCVLVSKGNRDKEIAHALGVSTGSVSASIHRARKKLRVRTRVELATVCGHAFCGRAHP